MALKGVFKLLIVADLEMHLWVLCCFSSDSETLQFNPSTQNTSVQASKPSPPTRD
jgi:hypothetical protein